MQALNSDSCEATEHSSPAQRVVFHLLLVFATYPLWAMAFLWSFVLRAYQQLGRWPAPYQPDPKSLGFDFHYLAVFFSLLAFPFVSLVCVAGIIVARKCWQTFPVRWMLGFTLACAALAFVLAGSDPGLFVEWFFD